MGDGHVGRQDTQGDLYRRVVAGLVRQRKKKGLTQWDVARAIGTDQSQVSKLERYERRLDILDYARICRAIGLDPGKLLRDID